MSLSQTLQNNIQLDKRRRSNDEQQSISKRPKLTNGQGGGDNKLLNGTEESLDSQATDILSDSEEPTQRYSLSHSPEYGLDDIDGHSTAASNTLSYHDGFEMGNSLNGTQLESYKDAIETIDGATESAKILIDNIEKQKDEIDARPSGKSKVKPRDSNDDFAFLEDPEFSSCEVPSDLNIPEVSPCNALSDSNFQEKGNTSAENPNTHSGENIVQLSNDAISSHAKNNVSYDTNNVSSHTESIQNDTKNKSLNTVNNIAFTETKASGSANNSDKPTNVIKPISSCRNDAEMIASMFPGASIDMIYDKLVKHRKTPNRLELVTNEILEGVTAEFDEVPSANTQNQKSPETLICDIFSDVDEVLTRLKRLKPDNDVDPNAVYEALEAIGHKPERVNQVLNQFLNASDDIIQVTVVKAANPPSKEDTLVQDVQEVLKVLPHADPVDVLNTLEHIDSSKEADRIAITISKLRHVNVPNLNDQTITTDVQANPEGELTNHPLYKDMMTISRMFPNLNRNEIYAYLEAHYDNPNRIALVAEELLAGGNESQGDSFDIPGNMVHTGEVIRNDSTLSIDLPKSTSKTNIKTTNQVENIEHAVDVKTDPATHPEQSKDTIVPNDTAGNTSGANDKFIKKNNNTQTKTNISRKHSAVAQNDMDALLSIFPDADPNYLYARLEEKAGEEERAQTLAAELFNTKAYPKLKEVQGKQKQAAWKHQIQNMTFNLKEFIQMFPDCLTLFYNEEKPVTESYKKHALPQLKNYFPLITEVYINKAFMKHKFHLTPTVRELENEAGAFKGSKKKGVFMRRARNVKHFIPEEPDELFYKEMLFLQHEEEIKEYFEVQKREKANKFKMAKEKGELHECPCCCEDELLFEELAACEDGCLFCRECIKRSSEENIGSGKIKFPCLTGDCKAQFPTQVLQSVLPSKVFSNLLRKIQEEEIRQADIEGLESCPFCSFATIIDNPDEKIFKCLNPECLKESCRLCKEVNHIPLRCNEVEKQTETDIRTFIENKITEAMIRECWRCKKRFFKIEGCNKMTCSCGATMCYVCRKPKIGYEHFGTGPNKCPQDTDIHELHRQEMEKAGLLAKEKFAKDNVDVSTMKHDPMALIGKQKNRGPQGYGIGHPFYGYDDVDNDDVDSDEEYDEDEDESDDG
ncbi:unnamed protein product [Owenia fusiformis]|uniref:RING-type domain-containing protein n=1 Tax=Owenia fusiformis TaxID=6347 RepID=A0A8S4PCQ2_OWEFU|nr:unnamed protein product [Owenia fusiformis]